MDSHDAGPLFAAATTPPTPSSPEKKRRGRPPKKQVPTAAAADVEAGEADLPTSAAQAPDEEAGDASQECQPAQGRRRGAGSAQKQPTGGIVELTKELWQAAVTLRGSIEPADYKRFVLPIIFLRYLSLRYERRHAELERLVADPQSDCYGDTGMLDDPDEYRKVGAFIIPREARWDHIRAIARHDDIKLKLDDILAQLEDTYADKLRGLLPRVFASSNLDAESLRGLINLFSKDVFTQDVNGEDVLGRVYEYMIGEFANSEGKRGGEYFTPGSIVRTLVALLEPESGVVFDPCCGSGGMFVQSDLFTHHSRRLSFVGQESKEFTYRLCRMNLFIHGLDGNIRIGNSYTNDRHPGLRADYILANPPFNDGSKGENGWGAQSITNDDPRLLVGGERMPLSPRNANTMWILHFLHHLNDGGTAGFVMATGELSNGENARLAVRKALIERDYVDCIVQLTGQLFANTQIPCGLWFLSKSRDGKNGFRSRRGEILLIDGRRLGSLIPGSRKQKQLSDEEVEQLAAPYREFRRHGPPADTSGFSKVVTLEECRAQKYSLTPSRYVGSAGLTDDDEPFEEQWPRLQQALMSQMAESLDVDRVLTELLKSIPNG